MKEFALRMKGEARVRLFDVNKLDEIKRIHSSESYESIRDIAIQQCLEYDSDWSNNTITDNSRLTIAAGTAFGNNLDIFIHQSTNPASTFSNTLFNTYSSQTPSQVRTPDTTTLNQTLLVQTRTTQFSAPSIARDINIIGLTYATATNNSTITGIAAYTLLSSTIVQGIAQVADVQYRVTFSMDD